MQLQRGCSDATLVIQVNTHARQPNSFIFRLLPYDPSNLDKGGKLQVLQVASLAHAGPIVFHDGQADADILSDDVKDLHTYGKIFKTTSNAHTLTGDGMGIAFRRGIPLEDMEFFQFHPTGLAGLGILLTEGARGEGAILRNANG